METQENASPREPVQTEKEYQYSGPLVTSSKTRSTSFNKSSPRMLDEGYVEVTLDIREDDTVLVRNIKAADPGNSSARLTNKLERKPSSTSMSLASQMSFKFKQVSHELKRMKSSLSFKKVDRTTAKPGVARALNGLKFMTKNVCSEGWPEIETRFDQLSLDGTTLPKLLFAQCIGMKDSSDFACELFDALARRRGITSCCVTKEELREFWEQISDHSFNARLQTFFDMVDKNADGRISEEEVKEIITLSASANNLSKIIAQSEEYAALIMEELDRDNLGYIDLYNLQMLLLPGPDQFSDLDTNSRMQSRLLSEKLVPTKEHNPVRRWCRRLVYFVEDNWRRIWVIALWLSICTGLFAWKFIQYKQREVFHIMGYCVSIAKGGAETLKFNMALILLPVCRNTITWLRSETKLGFVIPFDDNINFHKVIALGILVGVSLHAGSHLTCDFPKLLHSTNDQYDKMKPFFGHKRPENYWWFVKGTEGWTGLVMVVLMLVAYTLAQPWFRRNRLRNLPKTLKKFTGFNSFWYSHHLFFIVYILFIVHGYFLYLSKNWDNKTTWMYLAFPIVMYACERVLRAFRSGYESVKILKVAVYPGNVLALHMSKPQGFKYTSGQYIYLNCSDISSFQWHPFSITSAPGDDYLSVHIRTLGDWTSQLKYIFSKVCQPPSVEQSGLLRADIGQPNIPPRMPRLRIDGPYGAPAQDYKEYEVILLVGLGIGATPLISIVKDVLNNIKQRKEIAAQTLSDNSIKRKSTFATKRAYFYWITREQGSFEWFRGVMNEVAENDLDGVIELHNYCTSVYEEGDARSALITMLQSIHHAKNGVDVVSGTRVKTHFARPNWRNVFKHVAVKHPEQRVGVFYCGAHGLVGELKRLAQDFSRKTETKFDFHKENF